MADQSIEDRDDAERDADSGSGHDTARAASAGIHTAFDKARTSETRSATTSTEPEVIPGDADK